MVRRSRAFTLIEAMAVALIVGVLATLAIVGYQKWVRNARLGEAQDMVASIRAAEEAYRAENGSYLNVSTGLVTCTTASGSQPIAGSSPLYPAAVPGAFKTAWGAACSATACTNPNAWNWLAVAPQHPVLYGYAVVAGTGSVPTTQSNAVNVNGSAINLSAMNSGPYYIVEAVGDTNGDGVFTTVFGFSSSNQIFVDHEGE